MAIFVTTTKPKALLKAIKQAIDGDTIRTWEYDKDGDFTHTPKQWNKKAWLRPHAEDGILRFQFMGQEGVETTDALYGAYHGRFIEELFMHFRSDFDRVRAP